MVLHNMDRPSLANWPGFDVKGKPISFEQRLKNMQHGYEVKGWPSGPHLMIDQTKIWAFNPLWIKGTHSPSFNSTRWGVEMPGNYDLEDFPLSIMTNVAFASARLYEMLGHECTARNFNFHKDDPRTTHHDCPGVRIGPKNIWIDAIARETAFNELDALHIEFMGDAITEEALKLVMVSEAYRETEYSDRGFPAIGYGMRDGYMGFKLLPGMKMPEPEARAYLKKSLEALADSMAHMLSRKPNPNQLGAFVSFAYNVGLDDDKDDIAEGFGDSTLLKKFNAGDDAGAAEEFGKWVKAKNPKSGLREVMPGLVKRRAAERALFLKPIN